MCALGLAGFARMETVDGPGDCHRGIRRYPAGVPDPENAVGPSTARCAEEERRLAW